MKFIIENWLLILTALVSGGSQSVTINNSIAAGNTQNGTPSDLFGPSGFKGNNNLVGATGPQTLRDGAVLGVDRQEGGAMASDGGHHHGPRRHQAFAPDNDVIEHHRLDADQRAVADRAAVQHHLVPHCHVLAQDDGHADVGHQPHRHLHTRDAEVSRHEVAVRDPRAVAPRERGTRGVDARQSSRFC